MAKSLCKYRRVEIADQFAKISSLVSEPRFVCSSCARAASDKAYLCKPTALKGRPAAKAPEPSPAQALAAPVNNRPEAVLPAGSGTGSTVQLPVPLTKKQAQKIKQLAKKKNKRLNKAAKAVQRYEKALAKAKKRQEPGIQG